MTIDERTEGEITFLDVKGKLVSGDGDRVLRETLERLVASGTSPIVLNLLEVSYVDSAGLGEIVRGHNLIRRKGGDLRVMHLSERVREMVKRLRLIVFPAEYPEHPESS